MQEGDFLRPTLSQALGFNASLARLLERHRVVIAEGLLILAFGALIALCARITIPLPFTPVPITGQTFAVLLTGAVLGSKRGALSLITYVGLGVAGLPVFALSGGVATRGYLVGFIAAAFVVGWLAERGWDRSYWRSALAMLAGNAVLYVPGLLWLANFVGPEQAIPLGLLPFIPGDIIKLMLAAAMVPSAWKLVSRNGVHI